jgi:hypothetical protein
MVHRSFVAFHRFHHLPSDFQEHRLTDLHFISEAVDIGFNLLYGMHNLDLVCSNLDLICGYGFNELFFVHVAANSVVSDSCNLTDGRDKGREAYL